jgi:hypothetical protein
MNEKENIESTIHEAIYRLKEGTSTSYYWQSGSRILPDRMSISFGAEITHAEKKGRMLAEEVIGEIKGGFKVVEQSPLKQHPPFHIHSKIFRPELSKSVMGYAVIGISNEDGRIARDSEEGLAAICNAGDGVLQIYFCPGITTPTEKERMLAVIDRKEKGWPVEAAPMGYKTIDFNEATSFNGKDSGFSSIDNDSE